MERTVSLCDGLLGLAVLLVAPLQLVDEVWAEWITIGIAWFGGTVFFLKQTSLKVSLAVSFVLAVLAVGIGLHVKPEQRLVGIIKTPVEPSNLPRLAIGNSTYEIHNAIEGIPVFQFFENNGLAVELINRRTKISTMVYDESGTPIVEISRNVWKISDHLGSWDRNYDDRALEVKDRRGRIIFQLDATGDRLQLQGEWCTESSNYSKTKAGFVSKCVKLSDSDSPRFGSSITLFGELSRANRREGIKPIFRYPGAEFIGVRVGESTFRESVERWGAWFAESAGNVARRISEVSTRAASSAL